MARTIILIVIAILVLSFFGITIQSVVQSPVGQANFAYAWSLVIAAWDWFVNLVSTKASGFSQSAS